jgi:hypothetical protein
MYYYYIPTPRLLKTNTIYSYITDSFETSIHFSFPDTEHPMLYQENSGRDESPYFKGYRMVQVDTLDKGQYDKHISILCTWAIYKRNE